MKSRPPGTPGRTSRVLGTGAGGAVQSSMRVRNASELPPGRLNEFFSAAEELGSACAPVPVAIAHMHNRPNLVSLACPNRMRTRLNFSWRRTQPRAGEMCVRGARLSRLNDELARSDCCRIAARRSKESTKTAESRNLRRRNEPSSAKWKGPAVQQIPVWSIADGQQRTVDRCCSDGKGTGEPNVFSTSVHRPFSRL